MCYTCKNYTINIEKRFYEIPTNYSFILIQHSPNIPKFETVMVPPWNSCGCNFPSRALAASSLIDLLISTNPLRSACGTIGVIKPLSVATATEHSTESYLKRMIY